MVNACIFQELMDPPGNNHVGKACRPGSWRAKNPLDPVPIIPDCLSMPCDVKICGRLYKIEQAELLLPKPM